jgi:hypothetical protein
MQGFTAERGRAAASHCAAALESARMAARLLDAGVGQAILRGLAMAAILIGLCMAFLAADPAHAADGTGRPANGLFARHDAGLPLVGRTGRGDIRGRRGR